MDGKRPAGFPGLAPYIVAEGFAMDLTLIYRIAGLGILIAIFNIILNQAGRQEQSQMLSLAGVVLVLLILIQLISQLFDQVESVFRWY